MQTKATEFNYFQEFIDFDKEVLKNSVNNENSFLAAATRDHTVSQTQLTQLKQTTFNHNSSSVKGNSSHLNRSPEDFHRVNFSICDECLSDQIAFNSHEASYVCQNCALVLYHSCITDDYYMNAEWDSEDEFEHREIDDKYGFNNGIYTKVTGKEWEKYNKYTEYSYEERMMRKEVKKEMKNFAILLNIKEGTFNLAKSILKELTDKKIRKGLSQSGKLPAILLFASRQSRFPRDINQVLLITGCESKHLNEWYQAIKALYQELTQYRNQTDVQSKQVCDSQESKLTEQMCNRMNMNMEIIIMSREIAQRIKDTEALTGKKPQTISAVAIHICVKLSKQSELIKSTQIVKATGVAQKTIRAAFKVIKDYLPEIVPKEWSGYGNLHTLLQE